MRVRARINLNQLLTSPIILNDDNKQVIVTWLDGYETWKMYMMKWVPASGSYNWKSKYENLISETMFDLLMVYVAPNAIDLTACYYEYDDELATDELMPNEEGLCGRDVARTRATVNKWKKIYSWLVKTAPRYETLLNLYKAQQATLMKKVETKVGSSDMPQSATLDTLGTSLKDDLSRARIELDEGGTPMARLAEIQENYDNLMESWADEFLDEFALY